MHDVVWLVLGRSDGAWPVSWIVWACRCERAGQRLRCVEPGAGCFAWCKAAFMTTTKSFLLVRLAVIMGSKCMSTNFFCVSQPRQ
jgi:hypothetical protein